jgi:hypothetical protein
MNKIALGILYCIFGQIFVWLQINAQFVWPNSIKYYWFTIVLGGTITSLFFMNGVKQIVAGFDGQIWPSRLIPTATGMFVFSLMAWIFLKQGIDIKTGVCLILAIAILIIQLYWK